MLRLFALSLSLWAGSAQAAIYVEDFESDFPAWKSGVIATHSNLSNEYEALGFPETYRGNNPDGLWIGTQTWTFTPLFSASLTSLSFDVATWLKDLTVSAYDATGDLIGSTAVPQTPGANEDPGIYESLSFSSATGILKIVFSNLDERVMVLGNTSIDNIVAVTNRDAVPDDPFPGQVPLPGALPLFATAMAGLGLLRWRRRRSA